MDGSLTKKQLIILESFTRAVQEAETADEVAEILLNSLFEAFPGFDEGYVFLPDGKGRVRPVVLRRGLDVSYPSKRFECLAETVAEAERTGRVEELPDGSIIAVEGGGEQEGMGILGMSGTISGRSRLCVPLEGVVNGYLEFRSSIDRLTHLEYLAGEMREFVDIAANALTSIEEDAK